MNCVDVKRSRVVRAAEGGDEQDIQPGGAKMDEAGVEKSACRQWFG